MIHVQSVDAGLHYSTIIPTVLEWEKTFHDSRGYGPLHLWMRCAGKHIRGYFFIENLSHGHQSISAKQNSTIQKENFLLIDGQKPENLSIKPSGTEFYFHTNKNNYSHTSTLYITFSDWIRYSSFPLSFCEPSLAKIKKHAPPRYIMNIFTWDLANPGSKINKINEALLPMIHNIARYYEYNTCLHQNNPKRRQKLQYR
jgi:hypothetical protein